MQQNFDLNIIYQRIASYLKKKDCIGKLRIRTIWTIVVGYNEYCNFVIFDIKKTSNVLSQCGVNNFGLRLIIPMLAFLQKLKKTETPQMSPFTKDIIVAVFLEKKMVFKTSPVCWPRVDDLLPFSSNFFQSYKPLIMVLKEVERMK